MTSPFGNLAVIADPRAGASLEAVERGLASRGLAYRLQVSDGHAHSSRLAGAALDEGYRYLAAVGDDRTVQDVVNGMFRDGKPVVEEPVLGVVPALGPCDLMRSFGMPDDVDDSIGHLTGDTIYPFDVMKIAATDASGERRIRYGTNLAQIGFHAAAAERAAGMPAWFGNVRRFLGFWSAYVTQRTREVTLGVDTREHHLRTWSVVVGNGQFIDGGIRLSPRSYPGDGVLDALAFVGPRSQAYRLLPRMFRHGDHIPDDGIKELRARIKVSVESDRVMPVVVDGVPFGTTPVSFQVVPQPILLKL